MSVWVFSYENFSRLANQKIKVKGIVTDMIPCINSTDKSLDTDAFNAPSNCIMEKSLK